MINVMSKINLYQFFCLLVSVSALLTSYKLTTNINQQPINDQAMAYKDVQMVNSVVAPILIDPADQKVIEQFTSTISAESIYVMDVDSSSILLEKNSSLVKSPASITKLLTALLSRKIYDLDQVFVVTDENKKLGNKVGLMPGEKISVRNLLMASLIQSGNDAAYVLANNHPNGYQAFIQEMNQLAGGLGLSNTYFTNPAGFDDQFHQSTAKDLAILTKQVMLDDFLKKVVGTKMASIADQKNIYHHQLFSTNALLGSDGVVGVKTGTTEMAKEALITQVERDGHAVIIVVLTSQDRYFDTKNIINFIFDHYRWQIL